MIACKEAHSRTAGRDVAGVRFHGTRCGSRPSRAQRDTWRSRSDLLAGWLADEWKRQRERQSKEASHGRDR